MSAPDSRDRCIVFLHIPKTGGVTLRRTLKRKYSRVLSEETLDQAAPRRSRGCR